MSRARPKSQILATLWSVNRTFLAATSRWMHCRYKKHKHTSQTTPKGTSHSWQVASVKTIMTETKTLSWMRHRGWWQEQREPMRPRPILARGRKHQGGTSTTTIDRFKIIYHKQLLSNVCLRCFSYKIFPHNRSHSWQPGSRGLERPQGKTSGGHQYPEASQHSPPPRWLGKIRN